MGSENEIKGLRDLLVAQAKELEELRFKLDNSRDLLRSTLADLELYLDMLVVLYKSRSKGHIELLEEKLKAVSKYLSE